MISNEINKENLQLDRELYFLKKRLDSLNKDLSNLNSTEYIYLEEILHDCILLSKLKNKRDSFK
jgi:hypothetical protein